MSAQWRQFLAALRFCTQLPAAALGGAEPASPGAAVRYLSVAGAVIGAAGGIVYWLGTQFWPSSIAVVLSMLATMTMARRTGGDASGLPAFVFGVLLKYNSLMALSAASLPFAVPANTALGLIMICGYAASCGLIAPLISSPADRTSAPPSTADVALALGVGMAPAALLGIPGLIGLAAAIIVRVGFGAWLKRARSTVAGADLYAAQLLSEVCFYLGALASWAYA
jgi:adenosylcobinamide-GDP ribazoletransferase